MDLVYFKSILERTCKIDLAKPIVLGVSGGPDSLFLLEIFVQLGLDVIVAHFNHHLRKESDAEARFVKTMAKNRKYRFIFGEDDVRTQAIYNKRSIEEQARISRYTFLFHSAHLTKAQGVAVAHTADDQVETILMHFLRGSGLDGLSGMLFRSAEHGWDSEKPLFRPLLETWRDEIEKYCRDMKLNPNRDVSNLDSRYHRNRIRNELIPFLESYNPKIKAHIIHLSQIIQEEIPALKTMQDRAWEKILEFQDQNSLVLKLPEFRALDLASQRQILRRIQQKLTPGFRDLGFDSIERIAFLLTDLLARGAYDWSGGIHLLLNKKTVTFHIGKSLPLDHNFPQIKQSFLEWNLNSQLSIENGFKIFGEIFQFHKRKIKPVEFLEPNNAWLDAAMISFPLTIRKWKKGDRLLLFGMAGKETKLSNFWINNGIPRNARLHYPLVCNGNEIIWIPGMRISDHYRITDKTKEILHLFITKERQ